MELGLCSFGDVPVGAPPEVVGQRLRDLVAEIELADQVGLDVYAIGEHHREDFSVSTPAIVMAAAAERTRRIRLSSAVTVLSTDDPVRVFQDFATVDLLSGGRAEIIAGRGSFTESFPLFGYDLADYDELFAEKLDLLLQIRETPVVTWSGKFRPAIEGRLVFPRPLQDPFPIWVGTGGNPQSAVRAGVLNLPLAIAIIGGQPERFKTIADLHREGARRAGHEKAPALALNSHGYVADDSKRAGDEYFPHYASVMNRIGRERGWPPLSRPQFDAGRPLHGHLFVGSPEEVAEKILFQFDLFRHDRFLIQTSLGPMQHSMVMRSIELFGTKVAPLVRDEIARRAPATA